MGPVLEFSAGQQAPFAIVGPEIFIGRGAMCALRIDEAAAERHARLTVDAAGQVYIQDLDTHTGTLRNGNFVYGAQPLVEGDRIEIGGVALVFHAAVAAPVVAAAPPSPVMAPGRAGAADRTQLAGEVPPEVRAALAERDRAEKAAAAAKAPARPQATSARPQAVSGVIVGTPEPEPANFRTVQMGAMDLATLGIEAPRPAAASPTPPPKRTIVGMPPPVLPGALSAPPASASFNSMPTGQMAAQTWPPPEPAASPLATQPTMMAQAPVLPVQYAQPQYQQHESPPPQQPQYAQPQHQQPQHAQPQHQQPQYAQPQYAQPQPQYQQPQYAQPQYAQPQYAQPQYAQPQQPPPAVAAPQAYAAAPQANPAAAPYTPPAKGAFGSFSRALSFMGQIFTLARQHKALLKPLLWDVILTTPIMAAFAVLDFFIDSPRLFYASMAVEAFLLYFVDYACNAITASLVYDYATTGQASLATAVPRVKKALPGVLSFAAVSALLDVASTYARERNDLVARIVLRILRAIWTTATYVIMPALVIEGISFGAAFKRSKQLMAHDPTGVGAGVVAMSITSYIVAAVCFPLAYFAMRGLGYIHPAIGALGAMVIVNLYWAVSGWMKISYSTCFYLWARECERTGTADHALAPAPLRIALDAA